MLVSRMRIPSQLLRIAVGLGALALGLAPSTACHGPKAGLHVVVEGSAEIDQAREVIRVLVRGTGDDGEPFELEEVAGPESRLPLSFNFVSGEVTRAGTALFVSATALSGQQVIASAQGEAVLEQGGGGLLTLTLLPGSQVDAGNDAGTDAGEDSGMDAGDDGGHNPITDAGDDGGQDPLPDAGSDGGLPSPDAGDDAGTDAGSPGPVGAVTDLRVLSRAPGVVTLRFTEVDDGTGAPAQYDVRFGSPMVGWGSAISVTSGTCATPVAGLAIGQERDCTVSGLTDTAAYDFRLVSFRGTLNLNAVFGPLSNLASTP